MDKKNLKDQTKALGIRQIEIATELGVSESFINRILNGWKKPSDALSKKIMAYIEKRREKLIGKSKAQADKQA